MDKRKIQRINVNCDFCKNEIKIIPYDYKNLKHHFCNMDCRNSYLRENPPRNWLGKSLSKEHNEKLQRGKLKNIKENGMYNQIDLSSKKEFIKEMYEKGNSLSYIGNILGVSKQTVNRNMQRWDLPRRKPLRDKAIWKCDDGHIVKSSIEMYIDNWLFHNGIIHVYEKHLAETRFTCDFYIPEKNIYIEYWGMINKDYVRKMKKKLLMYEKLGLINNMVNIFPKDKVEDKLRFLLSISKTQRGIIEYEEI